MNFPTIERTTVGLITIVYLVVDALQFQQGLPEEKKIIYCTYPGGLLHKVEVWFNAQHSGLLPDT